MFSCFVFVFMQLCCYSCSGQADFFKIEGRLRNISQGEFYLYTTSGAMTKIDTIVVMDGRFAHQTFIDKPTTLTLVFPNFSEQPIFAAPGRTAKIKGDASHLRELEITGTKENRLMTDFRLSIINLPPPQVLQRAEAFITDNKESPVALYLIEKYFIKTPDADYSRAIKLLTTIISANPNNTEAKKLRILISKLTKARKGSPLPAFTAQTIQGKKLSQTFCKDKAGVIYVWASWNYDSQSLLWKLNDFCRNHADEAEVITISLDMSTHAAKQALNRTSLELPTICDQQVWSSPIVQNLAINQLPEFILIDKNGHIHSRHTEFTQMETEFKTLTNNQ